MPFPFNPDQYDQQLHDKLIALRDLFDPETLPEVDVYPSRPEHYRMRAEFKLWHDGDESWYAMFNPAEPKKPIRVDEFPVGSRLINDLMGRVRDAVHQDDQLRRRLFQVEFLTTQEGDALITLIYHKKLDEAWEERGRHWQEVWGFPVIGRARKQRLVLSRDYVNETLEINGRRYRFRQYENSFTQPNAGVCEQMVGWAQRHTEGSRGDLLELYCGNGNFSIPLAGHFRKALGTEISRVSVNSAQHNIEANGVDNLRIARMSSEDFANAWLGRTQSRRLREWGVEDYDFTTLLVDPPRAGLDDDTLALARHFDRIVYISCNPETLAANVRALGSDYRIEAAALFDQFPYTHHMEAGLVLSRV
ncbi:tRNA (uridine(54)-C5)-methyltransferase TrmA [Saccharospirillum salsuginis]|uniref:tRNA/tmRNA (uracil-C(5))-methyltransferase n=1 Tax=Saccharospirillum salsuginis TaxID=418750 RepID=A0A918K6V8_9GAMM|nr:tRNA (uridine(54)-C5)-methyltransferase TrmA [Saccharospirillum salsuginis]GGX51601.1 tRNA/tmRNA (uracil-C(5))-methyltransferase [Saccharospirillum salsuginis]